ncbi:ORC ubiquitin ligase 1 isoform X2 [Leucoraja erinacea]|uniref:ORC ubiquitin ligase 1 isoform X2 n=1 Tax=Leucoraja erinaceus TaxID=7782 RepID=UPI002455674A|nr:ORC ubiquitin ligase 1 isoform X2 [Leucoraja erinacea]
MKAASITRSLSFAKRGAERQVRHPVICSNNHVFCFMCMESWLKNSTQCPTCRIPITSENPYKEVLGGSDGTENCDSSSVKRSLRKTRLELLHTEYEEEIESLQKEIEDLRGKNLSLESQLKTVLDPAVLPTKDKGGKQSPTGQDSVPNLTSQREWRAKVKAATEIYEKTKVDLDKLKEANRKLRMQNGDLVRENLHLKAEVENRSPQKFGRFTVAALQSKVEQNEREMNRLKRALERSDKYIEDMEFQIERLKGKSQKSENNGVKLSSESSPSSEHAGENGSSGELWDGREDLQEKRIMPLRSLSEIEQSSVNQLASAQSCQDNVGKIACESLPNKRLPTDNGLLATATVDNVLRSPASDAKDEERVLSASESEIRFELPSPCTPSTSLGGLHLDSTDDEASPLMKKRGGDKKLGYLRRLCFDDARWRNACFEEQILSRQNVDCNRVQNADLVSENLMLWDCHPGSTESAHKGNLRKSSQTPVSDNLKSKGKMSDLIGSLVSDVPCFAEFKSQRSRTSSETSMEAAYREKISELDFMLDETENTRNPRCSPLSQDLSDLDTSSTSDLAQCAELLNEAEKRLEQKRRQNQLPVSDTREQMKNRGKSAVPLPSVSPVTSNLKEEYLSSEEKSAFHCRFNSPFLSVPSELSVLENKKPSLWNCLMAENEQLLGPANRCPTSKRKPPNYGEDLASPSKTSKKDFVP